MSYTPIVTVDMKLIFHLFEDHELGIMITTIYYVVPHYYRHGWGETCFFNSKSIWTTMSYTTFLKVGVNFILPETHEQTTVIKTMN